MVLQGNLDAFPLPEVIRLLARSQQTGVLVIDTDAGETRCYLEDGHLVFACNADATGLYHALVTGELVTEAGWEEIINGEKSATDALAPDVSMDDYEALVFSTAVDSFVDALETAEGAFEFSDGVTTAIELSMELGVEPVLAAAEERAADWVRLRELLPSRRSKLRLAEAWTEQAGEIILGTDEWTAISMVTQYKTRAAIVQGSGWSEHTTAVRVANLLEEGLIELVRSASGRPVELFGEEHDDKSVSLPDSEEPEMPAAEAVMLGPASGDDAPWSLGNDLDAIAPLNLTDGALLIPLGEDEVSPVPFVTDSDVEFELKGLGERNALERARPIGDDDLAAAAAHVELPLSELLAEHRVDEKEAPLRSYERKSVEMKVEQPELETEPEIETQLEAESELEESGVGIVDADAGSSEQELDLDPQVEQPEEPLEAADAVVEAEVEPEAPPEPEPAFELETEVEVGADVDAVTDVEVKRLETVADGDAGSPEPEAQPEPEEELKVESEAVVLSEVDVVAAPPKESMFETYAEAVARTLAEQKEQKAQPEPEPQPELEAEVGVDDADVADVEDVDVEVETEPESEPEELEVADAGSPEPEAQLEPQPELEAEVGVDADDDVEVETEPEFESEEFGVVGVLAVADVDAVSPESEPRLEPGPELDAEVGVNSDGDGVEDVDVEVETEPESEPEELKVLDADADVDAVSPEPEPRLEPGPELDAEVGVDSDSDGGADVDVEVETEPEFESEEFGVVGVLAVADADENSPDAESDVEGFGVLAAEADAGPLVDRLNNVVGSMGSVDSHPDLELIEGGGELDAVDHEAVPSDTDLAGVLAGLSESSADTPATGSDGIAQADVSDDDTSNTQESDIAPETAEEVESETKPRRPKRRRSRGLLSRELSSLND